MKIIISRKDNLVKHVSAQEDDVKLLKDGLCVNGTYLFRDININNGFLVCADNAPDDIGFNSHYYRSGLFEAHDAIKVASDNVRSQRNKMLAETDWVITKAVEQNAQDGLGIQVPQVWLDYRQALRDITDQDTFPNVIWPSRPQG
jgi:hypothetical protein